MLRCCAQSKQRNNMIATEFTQGYYSVNEEIFANKMYAVKRAISTKSDVKWHYFDDVFSSVNTSNLGQVSLSELYRQRAQQLRDSYDCLVLYYSGGSDSWNVLNTFLKNNIKLDCVYVYRPVRATDKDLYIPNQLDFSDRNHVSEWDFVIKKDLDWLAAHHPDIHIEIGDWTDVMINANNTSFERILETATTQNSLCTLFKNVCPCQYERRMLDRGNTVGKVMGIDKPKLEEVDGKCYFYFVDTSCPYLPVDDNPAGVEYFYISPDFPSLTVEQAYAVLSYYKNLPEKMYMLRDESRRYPTEWDNWTYEQIYQVIYKKEADERPVLYPDWDMHRFQSGKAAPRVSLPPGVRSGEEFLWKLDEFKLASSKWEYHWNELFSPDERKDRRYLVVESQFKVTKSKRHYLATLW